MGGLLPPSRAVERCRDPATIRALLRMEGGAEKSSTYLSPYSPTRTKVRPNRRDRYLFLLVVKEGRLVSQGRHEGEDVRCCANQGILCVLHSWQVGAPSRHTPESILEALVRPVEDSQRRDSPLPEGRAEGPPHMGCKLQTPVRHNVPSHPAEVE